MRLRLSLPHSGLYGDTVKRGLKRLLQASAKVASVDLDAKVKDDSSDELAESAQVFDAMATRVSSNEEGFELLVDRKDYYALCMLDVSGRVSSWNPAAERMFGYTGAEIIGHHHACLFEFDECGQDEPSRTLELARQRGAFRKEGHGVRSNGRRFLAEASVATLTDARDNLVGYAQIVRDLTECSRMRKVERQFSQSQRIQSVGTLTGGIAHEFNNIFLAISGNLRLALQDCSPAHPAYVSLMEIEKAADRATALSRRLLTLSDAGQAELKPMSLQSLAREILPRLRAVIPATIEVRFHCDRPLPNVRADAGQIEQLFVNLAENAVHAIGSRSGAVDVFLEPLTVDATQDATSADLPEGDYVRIKFVDNGCGMSPAALARIFDRSFTPKAPDEGTDVGLSMVHSIVKNHNGAIRASSERNVGTCIEIYLPATHAASLADATSQSLGSQEQLLYLDDEESLVLLITRSLERLNYRVTGFVDPALALAAFRERPQSFDVFITDLSMPGTTGFEVAREVLDIRPDIPVIMTSGFVRPEDVQKAQELGIRAILLKPNTIDELARALHELFAEQGAMQRSA